MDRVLASKNELKAYHDGHRYFMPRTQEEAGIANMIWEDRLVPARSWIGLASMALRCGAVSFAAYLVLRFVFLS